MPHQRFQHFDLLQYQMSTSSISEMFLSTVLVFATLFMTVESHGRLIEPPSRSTMWRFGFDTPPNYNDNQLNCGGFSVRILVHAYQTLNYQFYFYQ